MRPHTKRRALFAAALLAATSGLAIHQQMAGATLNGLTFEGGDGNIVANGGTDWANLTPAPAIGTDGSGQTDNSFVQGSKEDEVNIFIESGSIPNSKADIGKFAATTIVPSSGDRAGNTVMLLAWIRNNDSGTTNFDFEINQFAQPDMSPPAPGTGSKAITLNRKGDGAPGGVIDDILIGYDLQGGAQNPTLTIRRWNSTNNAVDGSPGVWSAPVTLNAANSEGATNCVAPGPKNSCPNGAGALPASAVFGAAVSASRFGEAVIDLTALGIVPNQNDPNANCKTFSGVFVKSRASDAFTSQMKDFVAPVPFPDDNCGSIEVRKVTVPSPDASNTVFDYTRSGPGTPYDSPFTLQNGGSNKVSDLNPGSYTVTEAAETGWDFTSLICNDANGNVVGTTANITLDNNEDVICTYTNTQQGRVIIDKVTQPDPDPTNTVFDYTGSFGPFTLTNAQTPFDSGLISSGVYNVAETAEPGWVQVGSSCDDNSPVNAIDVAPGETVTCTFTNNGFGHIIVTKQTDPDGATQSFSYGTTGSGYAGFSLTDGQSNDQSVAPGSYSVTETIPAGWELSDIVCDDDDVSYDKPNGLASLVVDPGETINCLYTNEEDSSITVIKQVQGVDPGQVFQYTSNFGVPNLTPSAPPADQFLASPLDPGTYNVTESGDPNWLLVNADPASSTGNGGNVVCSSSNGAGQADNSSAISLQAGEHVICTFINEWQVGTIEIQKTAKHAGPGGAPTLEGVEFQLTGPDGVTFSVFTNAQGFVCVGPLAFGSYNVAEVDPAGYAGEADKTVVVDNVDHCSTPGGGESVSFENTPLTRIAVNVDSLVDGGTASVVNCVNQNGLGIGVDGFTDSVGDGGPAIPGTFGWSGDLLPGTYTCTIVIDP